VGERGKGKGRGTGKENTHPSAFCRYCVIRAWSPKKKPILTMVRTMSIREPRPGVFSRARSWAFIDWSYG